MRIVAVLFLLTGCVMPPTTTDGVPSNINYTVCLLWASCGVDAGSAGDTSKDGGATITPLRSLETLDEINLQPVPVVPAEPVG